MNVHHARQILAGLLIAFLAACAPAPTPTATPEPTPIPQPTAGPTSLIWAVTGDADPLRQPSGLALDPQGRLFVVDTLNHRLQIYTPDGQLAETWGSLGSGPGQFNFAWKSDLSVDEQDEAIAGVALDAAGQVYLTDIGNRRIQKLDAQGGFLMEWPAAGPSEQPYDLAVDGAGNIFTIDLEGYITRYDSQGSVTTQWGGLGVEHGLFLSPGYLALDSSGNVYASDPYQGAVQKFDGEGNLLARFVVPLAPGSGNAFTAASGLAVSGGEIYLTDYLDNRLVLLNSDGVLIWEWRHRGTEPGQLLGPQDIVVDAAGDIYVSESFNNRIQRFHVNR